MGPHDLGPLAQAREIERLMQENDRLRADARRYRFLRDALIEWLPPEWNGCKVGRFDLYWQKDSDDLDAAIDAEMAKAALGAEPSR